MCKPVRYVYPDCGHPIDPDPHIWTVESCLAAISLNRDCWIPQDLPDGCIEKKPWPNNNLLEPCYMPHESQQVEEVEEKQIDDVEDGQNCSVSTDLGPLDRSGSQTEDQCEDQEEYDIESHEKGQLPTTRGIVFDERKLIGNNHIFHELEPLHLDRNEPLLIDDLPLLDAEERSHFESTVGQDFQPTITDQDINNIVQVLEQTAEELAIASVEDNIEWALVAAVDLNAPVDPFDESEDEHIEMDEMWF